MSVRTTLSLCLLLASTAHAMDSMNDSNITTFIDEIKAHKPSNNKNDPYLAWHAYAVAINKNDAALLSTLEQNQVPLPDIDNLTFMMRHYALPYSIINPSYPQEPNPKALVWCLEHGANPNGRYEPKFIRYYPMGQAVHYNTNGAPHPLAHIAAYLWTRNCESMLPVLQHYGSSLCEDKARECAMLIKYVTATQIDGSHCPCLDQEHCPQNVHGRSSDFQIKRMNLCRHLKTISLILATYKGIALDETTANAISDVAQNADGSFWYDNSKQLLKEHAFPYTTACRKGKEAKEAEERKRQRAAYLKSLFTCGTSAQQVIPTK